MLKNITKNGEVARMIILNDLAKWIIIVLALVTLIFNTGVLYNDVKHIKETQKIIIKEISELKTALIVKK